MKWPLVLLCLALVYTALDKYIKKDINNLNSLKQKVKFLIFKKKLFFNFFD